MDRVLASMKTMGDTGDREFRRLGQSADRASERMGTLKGGISGVGLQLQDVVVQLQGGTNPFTIIAQQAPQAASAFGSLGIAIGTTIAIVAALAGAFFNLKSEVTKTGDLLEGALSTAFISGSKQANSYTEAIRGATKAQQEFLKTIAGGERTLALREIDKLGGQLPIGQIRDLLLGRAISNPGSPIGERGIGALNPATEAGITANNNARTLITAIVQAAQSGNPDAVRTLAKQAGLLEAASPENIALIQQLIKQAETVALSDAVTKGEEAKIKALAGPLDKSGAKSGSVIQNLQTQLLTVQDPLKGRIEAAKQALGENATDEEIKKVTELVTQIYNLTEAKKELRKEETEEMRRAKALAVERERERKAAYEATVRLSINQAEAGLFDDGRSPAARERGARVIAELKREDERRKAEELRDAERRADRLADILTKPFQDAAAAGLNAFTSMFEEMLRTGEVSAKGLAESFSDAIISSVAQVPALLAQIPISAGIESITKQISTALQNGSGLGSLLGNPFVAGGLGVTAGMFGSAALGGNATGSAIGSLGGSVLGGILGSIFPGVGTALGAGLGGLGGGLIGGLFGGGGGGNNGAGSALRLGTGLLLPGSDAKSGENQQRANAVLQSLQQTQQLLLRAGVSFDDTRLRVRIGDKSGFQLFANDNERQFGSLNQLQSGAFKELLASGSGYSANLETVIASVKGKRAEVVQDAIAFAAAFDKLTSPAGALIEQLRELNITFDQAASRAESYGLSVEEIEKARTKATQELLESAEDALVSRVQQIKGAFDALLDPIRSTLQGINIGGLSALSPSAQLELARGQFQTLSGRALAGDEQAIQQISGAGQTFLQQARQFGASGEVFQAAFREVNQVLSQVLATGEARQENILASLPDAIRNANIDTIAALQKGFGEMVDQVALLRAEIARVRPLAA